MKITKTRIPEVLLIETPKFKDERGYFMEISKDSDAKDLGVRFVQDNLSCSKQGVLRGLHYQLPPFAQGKLVRVLKGAVWDVAVDIRKSSPTFGKWAGAELSEENNLALYLPEGFAHGFVVLSKEALVLYKATNEYHPESERGIRWNDPALSINWPVKNIFTSDKDSALPLLKDAQAV
ncbi:MAG: dTDP-4-dehydrorhamnose 3,5-epimerase [Patescibacteria group bacterium]|nr:dTDP-4-dehydrorhamnose 3,5-epimerase [Patescibacteria group bacterium]